MTDLVTEENRMITMDPRTMNLFTKKWCGMVKFMKPWWGMRKLITRRRIAHEAMTMPLAMEVIMLRLRWMYHATTSGDVAEGATGDDGIA
jgi:hypothetical protein